MASEGVQTDDIESLAGLGVYPVTIDIRLVLEQGGVFELCFVSLASALAPAVGKLLGMGV